MGRTSFHELRLGRCRITGELTTDGPWVEALDTATKLRGGVAIGPSSVRLFAPADGPPRDPRPRRRRPRWPRRPRPCGAARPRAAGGGLALVPAVQDGAARPGGVRVSWEVLARGGSRAVAIRDPAASGSSRLVVFDDALGGLVLAVDAPGFGDDGRPSYVGGRPPGTDLLRAMAGCVLDGGDPWAPGGVAAAGLRPDLAEWHAG